MPEYPYIEVNEGSLTIHFTSFDKVAIHTFQAKTVLNLLQGYLEQDVLLNQGQWNGAVAVLENFDAVRNWPKVIEMYGSIDCAITRAKDIHEKRNAPTVVYAYVKSFGVKEEKIPLTDEDSIEDDEVCCEPSTKRMITLEDFT